MGVVIQCFCFIKTFSTAQTNTMAPTTALELNTGKCRKISSGSCNPNPYFVLLNIKKRSVA